VLRLNTLVASGVKFWFEDVQLATQPAGVTV
jgi:hypothetical protein